jgi:hypothetical protein
LARPVRYRAAALQPALPRTPARGPHPELAYGGLKPETINRLKAIAEGLDGGDPTRAKDRPIGGTRLIRDYQGI